MKINPASIPRFARRLLSIGAILLSSSANGGDEAPSDSRYSEAIIGRLRDSAFSLDLSTLVKGDRAALEGRLKSGRVASFTFPERKRGVDAFRYKIHVDRERNEYWVERHGGVRPVRDVYGPRKLPELP